MFRLKVGVRLDDMSPQLLLGLIVASDVIEHDYGVPCWVSSINDSTHRAGSDHYSGNAADMRSRHFLVPYNTDKAKRQCAATIQGRLGGEYVCVFENEIPGKRTEHFHLAYRPTTRPEPPAVRV